MKRTICFIVAAILLIASLVGCAPKKEKGGFEIVCTVFPIYDWVRNIVGEASEDISVTLLVKNGTDPHSYTPSPADIAKISSCDLIFYVGGESDIWVSDVIKEKTNKDMKSVALLETLGDRAFVAEEHYHHEHEHENGHDHTENAYDEHVWLSLKNAEFLCGKISETLCQELEECSEEIKQNAEEYIEKISSLDADYASAVASAERDTIVFADRFPFSYLFEDYDLNYFAAFSGCSADSEATFETVTFLAKKVDELEIKYLIILENSSRSLAETVISSSASKSAEILVIDSMQSINAADIGEAGYLSIMENNLSVVKIALS